ncbi:hypothetical protein VTL71DRAFT_13675 [Oculimacula yallundae]|uniref:2EXR domain-containing protein n=1 Tax=Oculimacula yallundae TaxID=86028 RepID=A0ABR4CLL4_9HELO
MASQLELYDLRPRTPVYFSDTHCPTFLSMSSSEANKSLVKKLSEYVRERAGNIHNYKYKKKNQSTVTVVSKNSIDTIAFINDTVHTTFPLFPEFPKELRLMIFEASIIPRNLMANGDIYSSQKDDPESFTVPALCHVNRESRSLAKKNLRLCTAQFTGPNDVSPPKAIRFSFSLSIDTFFCFSHTGQDLLRLSVDPRGETSSNFRYTPLRQIPKFLQSWVRRVVIMDQFHYLLGEANGRNTKGWSDEAIKARLFEYLSTNFGALEHILVINSIKAPCTDATRPCTEQLSQVVHTEGKWALLEEVKKEHPEWKGPKVFLGKITLENTQTFSW